MSPALELIAEPYGLAHISDRWKERAEQVYTLLEQLNAGSAPEDWPQRFYELGVGNFAERWAFTRSLGVYGARLEIGSRSSVLTKRFYMEGRKRILSKKLHVPVGRRDWQEGGEIAEIFELLATIAFTFDWDYAAARCVQEAITQGKQITIKQTMDWPKYPTTKEALTAMKNRP